jgi:hypothetical protein
MSFPNYPIPDITKKFHCRVELKDINSNLIDWFSDLDIEGHPGMPGEFFYTPPHSILRHHADHTEITDVAKLNWMWGGEGSLMDWYELKPGATLYTDKGTTPVKSVPGRARKGDIVHKFSATIGTPSLVNVGRLHGVRNLDQPRYVACFIPVWKGTRTRLTMSEATTLFQKYIVK